jgi:transcriptional regulator of acetoin/glycerol metabolism
LYLDELGTLSNPCQAKLLRVIEEGMVRRVGGVILRAAAPRWVVSCQARDPVSRIGGGIREDLWQRVSAAIVTLPPLRQRSGDIPLLVAHFLTLRGYPADWLDDVGMQLLAAAPWRGNVRELKQVVGRLVLSHDGQRVPGDAVRRELEGATRSSRVIPTAEPPTPTVEELVAICEAHGWQAPRIATALGVGRTTLFKRLKAWGVSLRTLREFTIVHRSSLNSRELR